MSKTTTNLGLIKPELTDSADITLMNENWDKVDALKGDLDNLSEETRTLATDLNVLKDPTFTVHTANSGLEGFKLSELLIDTFDTMPDNSMNTIYVDVQQDTELTEGYWVFQIYRFYGEGSVVGNLVVDYGGEYPVVVTAIILPDALSSWQYLYPRYTYGTTDVTEGSASNKPNGTIYFVYE